MASFSNLSLLSNDLLISASILLNVLALILLLVFSCHLSHLKSEHDE
jgi:hypothetical protein